MKQVVITMNENGSFSVNGNVSSTESLGLIELAKATIIRDLSSDKPVSDIVKQNDDPNASKEGVTSAANPNMAANG